MEYLSITWLLRDNMLSVPNDCISSICVFIANRSKNAFVFPFCRQWSFLLLNNQQPEKNNLIDVKKSLLVPHIHMKILKWYWLILLVFKINTNKWNSWLLQKNVLFPIICALLLNQAFMTYITCMSSTILFLLSHKHRKY